MPDDKVLLMQWRNGDNAAGKALFAKYGGSITTYFQRKLYDTSEVAALVNATFYTCIEARTEFKGPASAVRSYLYGIAHKQYLRLTASVTEEKSELPTITGVWRTADWHEREIYDMMGVRFRGHPDLRRILMWEGYPYHPLRKDFPVTGKPSELPDVAFTKTAPIEGGPFVTVAGGKDSIEREPRVRTPES